MKPINTTERQNAFWRFLLFFAITIAVIITAVLFSVQVPFKENEQMKAQKLAMEKERNLTDSFNVKMMETMQYLEEVNKQPGNDIIYDPRIKTNLMTMTGMTLGLDTTVNRLNSIYMNIVRALDGLQFAKGQIRDATSKDKDLAKHEQEITDLTNELKRCQDANERYQNRAQN